MTGMLGAARRNTKATVFYVASCATCGETPDGDGEEYASTETAAFMWAIESAAWWASPTNGLLYCELCRPAASWPEGVA